MRLVTLYRPVALCLAILSAGALASCRPEAPEEAVPGEGHGPDEAQAHGDAHRAEVAEGSEVAHNPYVQAVLRSVPSTPVVGFTGPEGEVFRVALRTPEVGHFPCTSCHIRPIGTKTVTLAQMHAQRPEHAGAARIDCYTCHNPSRPGALMLDCDECHEREGVLDLMPSPTAHLTVQLSHPSGRLRNCFTCHASQNPGYLSVQDGSLASLDEAYRLCAGCHFMQAEDWAGGAHGKRLGGWQGERVVLSCTGCHNPHDPLFPIRRPVTFPKIARREAAH
jgi:hypothetical protein